MDQPSGVASGDVTASAADARAIVWSQGERPSRMMVEWSTTESFQKVNRLAGPAAMDFSDYTTRVDLTGLPLGQRIFYRIWYEDLAHPRITSEKVVGWFNTPQSPALPPARDITVVCSADTCGQGFGINPDWGGYRLYETMRQAQPDLFVNGGDTIYADQPLVKEVTLDNPIAGPVVWKNLVTEAKSKVAQTLADFRGCFAYNLMDANMRKFNAEVPQLTQWDDHETHDNWYPGQILEDMRYTEKHSSILSEHARRAFFEYTPIRVSQEDPDRIYRKYSYGPLLEVFMLDERSYRGRNNENVQTTEDEDTPFMGSAQTEWLKRSLKASRATWKLIASDMPISLVVRDAPLHPEIFEAVANGDDGPPKGRELEFAGLFRFIKQNRIHNIVWVTADVHYCAAHYYDPAKAKFTDFLPFWEFVGGPLNAGTFGPNQLDATFGPQVKYQNVPKSPKRAPSEGMQFFVKLKIDRRTRALTASLHNVANEKLYSVELPPERAA
jgi:alkaline phosphatase D